MIESWTKHLLYAAAASVIGAMAFAGVEVNYEYLQAQLYSLLTGVLLSMPLWVSALRKH